MATFPSGLYNQVVDDVSLATLQATRTDDATYGHATVHRNDAAEMVALETYVGTNASQTTPVGANRVLASTSASASTWTATPTLTTITTTGAASLNSATVTNTTTTGALAVTNTITLSSNLAYDQDANGNILVYIGGVAGTLQEVWVPTTGSIASALTTANGTAIIRLLPGTHAPADELEVTVANTQIIGCGRQTTLNTSGMAGSGKNFFHIIANNVNLENFIITLGSPTDFGVRLDATAGSLSNISLKRLFIGGLSAGKTGVFTVDANTYVTNFLKELHITGTAGTGMNLQNVTTSKVDAIIDVDAGTHWTMDAQCTNNNADFICDLAGTNSGTNNIISENVF